MAEEGFCTGEAPFKERNRESMDEVRDFRQQLDELTKQAKKQGNRMSVQQIREKLRSAGLDETKLQLVYNYLDMMSIEVYDENIPEAASGSGEEHLRSLEQYMREMEELPPMDEVEELTLFHMAAEGDGNARSRIAERYLSAVTDLVNDIETREKETAEGKNKEKKGAGPASQALDLTGEFTEEDLIQEGNMGLLLALEHLERQENLAAYRAVLLNGVTSYMEQTVEGLKDAEKSDRRVVSRMNQLADAAHDLEEELDRKPSLEELSAYLDLPAEEIRDLLRVGGEDMKVDSL